jgi:cytochrome c553
MDWRNLLAQAACAAALVGCGAVETASSDRFVTDGRLIALSGGAAGAANACFTCHGLDGRGNGAGAPRLAGLDLGYLERQLEAYADGRRSHPEMAAIATRLAPTYRHLVSAHYAAMPYQPAPTPQAAHPVSALYRDGDPARGLPACATCHGPAGEGVGPANPPLGGQPASYLAEQMHLWRQSKRRNDPGNVMLQISQRLTPREIASLSSYAAALPGGPPRPGFPAASPAARRADPRNDASMPPPHGAAPAP